MYHIHGTSTDRTMDLLYDFSAPAKQSELRTNNMKKQKKESSSDYRKEPLALLSQSCGADLLVLAMQRTSL
jgi:hypothetical protein